MKPFMCSEQNTGYVLIPCGQIWTHRCCQDNAYSAFSGGWSQLFKSVLMWKNKGLQKPEMLKLMDDCHCMERHLHQQHWCNLSGSLDYAVVVTHISTMVHIVNACDVCKRKICRVQFPLTLLHCCVLLHKSGSTDTYTVIFIKLLWAHC